MTHKRNTSGVRAHAAAIRGNGANLLWLKERVGYQGDDCLIWPFARDTLRGHGHLGFTDEAGKHVTKKAHRLMCEMAHGAPPASFYEAAHECGNGHLGCVNPRHLSWKTRSQNQLDRRKHGTANKSPNGGRTRLTPEQIAEIRALKGQITPALLAPRYGMKRGGIEYWQNSKHEPTPPGTGRDAKRRRAKKLAATRA